MAMTTTARGTGTHNTSALSFTLSPASDFASGTMAVIAIACDNADSSGQAHSTFTVEDDLGNTWTRRVSPLYDPGAANAGVEGAMFTTPMNGGLLVTTTVITVTFDANTTAKCWTLTQVTPDTGYVCKFITGGVGTGSATTTPTITTGTIGNGNVVIGGLFNEQGTGQTVTQDGDTTNGTWSSQQTAEVGTTGAGMTISLQRKTVTAAATQTYNPTLGVSSDVILAWIEIGQEAILTPSAVTAAFASNTPSLIKGAVTKTPSAVTAAWATNTPIVTNDSGDTLLPTPVAAAWSTNAADVIEGPIIVTPSAFAAAFGIPAPSLSLGALVIQPTPAIGQYVVAIPFVDTGSGEPGLDRALGMTQGSSSGISGFVIALFFIKYLTEH